MPSMNVAIIIVLLFGLLVVFDGAKAGKKGKSYDTFDIPKRTSCLEFILVVMIVMIN